MSKSLDNLTPYLWIFGLALTAIYNATSWWAIPPAVVCGIWVGGLMADYFWKPIHSKERE
jgi:hypothetical protein